MKNLNSYFLISEDNEKPKLSTVRVILDFSKSYKSVKTKRLGMIGVLLN